jgi:thiol-disulfide isomerase/thioredoxin
MMKAIRILLLLLSISTITLAQENIFTYNKLPSVKLKTIKGLPFISDSITNGNKPVIISFWATWCKPCVRELTTISDVYDDWVEETGVKLFAISVDDSRSSTLVGPMINGKGWIISALWN